jgi:hypothetical protein
MGNGWRFLLYQPSDYQLLQKDCPTYFGVCNYKMKDFNLKIMCMAAFTADFGESLLGATFILVIP